MQPYSSMWINLHECESAGWAIGLVFSYSYRYDTSLVGLVVIDSNIGIDKVK